MCFIENRLKYWQFQAIHSHIHIFSRESNSCCKKLKKKLKTSKQLNKGTLCKYCDRFSKNVPEIKQIAVNTQDLLYRTMCTNENIVAGHKILGLMQTQKRSFTVKFRYCKCKVFKKFVRKCVALNCIRDNYFLRNTISDVRDLETTEQTNNSGKCRALHVVRLLSTRSWAVQNSNLSKFRKKFFYLTEFHVNKKPHNQINYK